MDWLLPLSWSFNSFSRVSTRCTRSVFSSRSCLSLLRSWEITFSESRLKKSCSFSIYLMMRRNFSLNFSGTSSDSLSTYSSSTSSSPSPAASTTSNFSRISFVAFAYISWPLRSSNTCSSSSDSSLSTPSLFWELNVNARGETLGDAVFRAARMLFRFRLARL